ncbi:MAG: family 78 glycoside hydrolase catalytic domain, partial [Phycisphaeraceae bacterium]|nr:family 78 glycoside hydrolase catalytic domain [Phycisphaeraceae bacterium]
GEGPPQSQPFLQYYDRIPLSLTAGEHHLAVAVVHLGTIAGTCGGLRAELIGPDGEVLTATGPDWRCLLSPAWRRKTQAFTMNKTVPFQEQLDAGRLPDGWPTPAVDDADWPAAALVPNRQPNQTGNWSRLVARDIPRLEETMVGAEAVTRVAQHTDLANRFRREDLSISLSAAGEEPSRITVEGAENLTSEGGGPVTIQGSTDHLAGGYEGRADASILLDFGRVVTGYPELDISGPAGSRVEIGYAERLVDGHFNNAIEGLFADQLTLGETRRAWSPLGWRAFRYLKLRFREADEPVTLHRLQVRRVRYPFELRGEFSCDSGTLEQVFGISRETLRLCSVDALMDTPWREAAQWLGDVAAVTVPGVETCFGDTVLPRKFFRQSASNAHPTGLLSNISNIVNYAWPSAIPDYSLWWLIGLHDHYRYSGETDLLEAFYPQAVNILHAHLPFMREDGLIHEMPYWVFIDWADVDRRGACAPYNAIFYGA